MRRLLTSAGIAALLAGPGFLSESCSSSDSKAADKAATARSDHEDTRREDRDDDDLLGAKNPGADFANPSGRVQSISTAGAIDTTNAFFQSLGTNGRACVTCHAPADGFGLSVRSVRARFFATCKGDAKRRDPDHDDGSFDDRDESGNPKTPTCGEDPLFRPVDGATSPLADVSTDKARLSAYRLLLSKGLIRIEREVPAGAEFEITEIDDPYGHATPTRLNFYRRPLVTSNLKFAAGAFDPPETNPPTIMWDGRESETRCGTGAPPFGDACGPGLPACPTDLLCVSGFCRIDETQCVNLPVPRSPLTDLKTQAKNATLTHAEGPAPTEAQLASIVEFERALFTAQLRDDVAGRLDADGANGGPAFLSSVPFFKGENRAPPLGPGQNSEVFKIFKGWSLPVTPQEIDPQDESDETPLRRAARRASIARGEALFNFRVGVVPMLGSRSINKSPFTCGLCHNAFEAGVDSAGTWGNGVTNSIGRFLASASRRPADLPLYTVRRKSTGETIQTTDLGRAMVTGRWRDLNKFKTPALRGLASHPPFRHDGSDATLADVVDSYQAAGFSFNFTAEEKADLVAFLESL